MVVIIDFLPDSSAEPAQHRLSTPIAPLSRRRSNVLEIMENSFVVFIASRNGETFPIEGGTKVNFIKIENNKNFTKLYVSRFLTWGLIEVGRGEQEF